MLGHIWLDAMPLSVSTFTPFFILPLLGIEPSNYLTDAASYIMCLSPCVNGHLHFTNLSTGGQERGPTSLSSKGSAFPTWLFTLYICELTHHRLTSFHFSCTPCLCVASYFDLMFLLTHLVSCLPFLGIHSLVYIIRTACPFRHCTASWCLGHARDFVSRCIWHLLACQFCSWLT